MEISIEAIRLSVVDFLIKPFEPASLLLVIRRSIEKHNARRRAEGAEKRLREVVALTDKLQALLGAPNSLESNTAQLMSERLERVPYDTLSPRERDVLRLVVADGLGNPEISAKLNITLSTVRNHQKAIYRKVGVGSKVELLRQLLQSS